MLATAMALLLLIVLLYFQDASGSTKHLCEYQEVECFKQAIKQRIYPLFMTGITGVEPSDPLRVASIKIDLPEAQFDLSNIALTGMKECQSTKIDLNRTSSKSSTFSYEFLCPPLTIEAEYKLNSKMDQMVDETGQWKIVYDEMVFTFTGVQERVEGGEGKLHVNIVELTPIVELRGDVESKFSILFRKEPAENYAESVEKLSRGQIMSTLMDKLISNIKNILKIVPIEDLHYINAD